MKILQISPELNVGSVGKIQIDLGHFLTDNKDVIMIDDYSVSSIVAGIERVLAYDTTTVKDMKVNALNAGIKKFDYLNYLHIAKEFINKLI